MIDTHRVMKLYITLPTVSKLSRSLLVPPPNLQIANWLAAGGASRDEPELSH